MATASPSVDTRTVRFQQKRERILDAATVLINRHGVKGMTFVDVAEVVGLNTTSVTYYFKRKEQLAAAVLERSLQRLEDIVAESGDRKTPRERVFHYVRAHFRHLADLRREATTPMASLSDIRALAEPYRSELIDRYNALFRKVRGFFGEPRTAEEKQLQTARTHVLAENVFWLSVWSRQYSVGDFPRICDRLCELLEHGLAPEGSPWQPRRLEIDPEQLRGAPEGMPDNFMRVATRLINQLGYRGVSVERIASELNVTKGSFYHHLEAKDDLVLDCFNRSYGRVSLVQRAARESGGDCWRQLTSAMATLLDFQLAGDDPLLRTTALQVLPNELRGEVLERSNRMARRFAGMIIDGISEGSVRAVDPLVASQSVMCAVNGAFELHAWAGRQAPADAVRLYASTVCRGLFAPPQS